MFEYLQETLSSNYKYFAEKIMPCKESFSISMRSYFISESTNLLILPLIKERFEFDRKEMSDFLIFNFIDEISQLESQIMICFNQRVTLVEPFLLHADGILEKAFNYEHQWM